jgi:hypothetical protein
MALQACIPTFIKWAIIEAVASTLFPMVSTCVLNQWKGYWLLTNALQSTITMLVKVLRSCNWKLK